jgi:hypothetical protein
MSATITSIEIFPEYFLYDRWAIETALISTTSATITQLGAWVRPLKQSVGAGTSIEIVEEIEIANDPGKNSPTWFPASISITGFNLNSTFPLINKTLLMTLLTNTLEDSNILKGSYTFSLGGQDYSTNFRFINLLNNDEYSRYLLYSMSELAPLYVRYKIKIVYTKNFVANQVVYFPNNGHYTTILNFNEDLDVISDPLAFSESPTTEQLHTNKKKIFSPAKYADARFSGAGYSLNGDVITLTPSHPLSLNLDLYLRSIGNTFPPAGNTFVLKLCFRIGDTLERIYFKTLDLAAASSTIFNSVLASGVIIPDNNSEFRYLAPFMFIKRTFTLDLLENLFFGLFSTGNLTGLKLEVSIKEGIEEIFIPLESNKTFTLKPSQDISTLTVFDSVRAFSSYGFKSPELIFTNQFDTEMYVKRVFVQLEEIKGVDNAGNLVTLGPIMNFIERSSGVVTGVLVTTGAYEGIYEHSFAPNVVQTAIATYINDLPDVEVKTKALEMFTTTTRPLLIKTRYVIYVSEFDNETVEPVILYQHPDSYSYLYLRYNLNNTNYPDLSPGIAALNTPSGTYPLLDSFFLNTTNPQSVTRVTATSYEAIDTYVPFSISKMELSKIDEASYKVNYLPYASLHYTSSCAINILLSNVTHSHPTGTYKFTIEFKDDVNVTMNYTTENFQLTNNNDFIVDLALGNLEVDADVDVTIRVNPDAS